MRTAIFTIAFISLFMACQNEPTAKKTPIQGQADTPSEFTVQTDNADLQYENLRLLPILASDAFIQQNTGAAELITLQEALKNDRFRITEKKPFGRREDEGAVNSLLVQNKTEAPVFLMAGEVVQGGQQDRVIAQDAVVAARSLTNMPVFCVEPGRWNYHDTEEGESTTEASDKKVYAFTGYYNVASTEVRKSAQYEHDQAAVWKHVADITTANNAETETGAYAGLEQSKKFTQARDRYLAFFKNKLRNKDKIIGVVAISGKEVIGADVFAHPTLFQKQYSALLHSYTTHALTTGQPVQMSAKSIQLHAKNLSKQYRKNAMPQYQGMILHWAAL